MRKKESEKVFVLVGAKWRDKVNGNTYFNTKVLEIENGIVVEKWYVGFQYGYDMAYFSEGVEAINKKYKGTNNHFVDGGSFWLTKRYVKNGWF